MSRALARWLVLGCALVGCAESSTEPGTIAALPKPPAEDDDLFTFVPGEADLILWADLSALRSSSWTKDSFDRLATDSTDDGLATMRDIDRVVYAKVPAYADGATILVAQGKPDRERLGRDFSARESIDRRTYRGIEMLVRGDEALAFLNKRTVISGLTLAVRASIDCNIGVGRAIDAESWFTRMRNRLARSRGDVAPVAALYVKLQPATREALKNEMGEGELLEEVAARVDLGRNLDAVAVGNVRTELQATDLAARLAERVRDARTRPIVAAFGFAGVLEAMRFSAKGTSVEAALHISQKQRAEIVDRMAVVADTMASMRRQKNGDKNKNEVKR